MNILDDLGEVEERMEEIGSTKIIENPKYKELNDDIQELYKQIRELLPKDKRKLLLELDIKYRLVCNENETIMYAQGVKDGIQECVDYESNRGCDDY